MIALIGAGLCLALLSWLLMDHLVLRRLRRLTAIAREAALGNIEVSVGDTTGKDELHAMARALQDLVAYLQAMADAADRLAKG